MNIATIILIINLLMLDTITFCCVKRLKEYIDNRIDDVNFRMSHVYRDNRCEHLTKYVEDLNARINLIKLSNKLKEGNE